MSATDDTPRPRSRQPRKIQQPKGRESLSRSIQMRTKDLDWIIGCRTQLNTLTSELVNGVKSLHLLFLIQNFDYKLLINMSKYIRIHSNLNFQEWNTGIRNILYHFRMLTNVTDLKANKKRINSALRCLSSSYINFVLKSRVDSTSKPVTCERVAIAVYQFLKLMVTKGDGSSNPLNLVDLILSSEELLRSTRPKGVAYYLMNKILADRNFYGDEIDTYLKFLALVSVFDKNFTLTKNAVSNCLDDSKYRNPPSIKGSKYLSFLKVRGETDEEEEELEPSTSENIFKRVNGILRSKLIKSSKLACEFRGVPKVKRAKIKKYLSKIGRKGSKKSGGSESQVNFSKKRCNDPRLSETIDEIMSLGKEHVEDSCCSTDMNEENESKSERSSSSASNRTIELNLSSVKVDGKSKSNIEEGDDAHAETTSDGSELDDIIILTDEEDAPANDVTPTPLINGQPSTTVNSSTNDMDFESGGGGDELDGDTDDFSTEVIESDSETVELERNDGKDTHFGDVKLEEGGDKDKPKRDEKERESTTCDMEIGDEDGKELVGEVELQVENGDGKIQDEDEEYLYEDVGELFEEIEEFEEEKVSNSFPPASTCPEETGNAEEPEVVEPEIPARVQFQDGTGKLEESESPAKVDKYDLRTSPRLKPKDMTVTRKPKDTTVTSSPSAIGTTEEKNNSPKATVVPGQNSVRILRNKVLLTPIKDDEESKLDEVGKASPGGSLHFTIRARKRTNTLENMTEPVSTPLVAQHPTENELQSSEKLRITPRQKRAAALAAALAANPSILDTPAKRTRSAMKKLEEIEVITVEEEPGEKSSTSRTRQSRTRLSFKAESGTKSKR